MLRLALLSLRNRWTTAIFTLATIAISVALLLGVQLVRTAGKDSFSSALSGTDLVVGARTGDVNLLLLSVFRIGDATASVSGDTYRKIAAHPDVAWTIPISLGDMHEGFRVLGTTGDYFVHYRYNQGQPLRLAHGSPFGEQHDAVIGAEVAAKLGYKVGDMIELSHGTGRVSFLSHGDKPFRISGILLRTGTPVDQTVHVSLEGLRDLHEDMQASQQDADDVTAFLVGMRSKAQTLTMQRALNTYRQEPLTAILPAVTLQELWKLLGTADRALMIVSAFVVGAGLLGMMTSLLAGLNERRREMSILRAIGARPSQIFGLMVAEAGLLAFSGVLAGAVLGYGLLGLARPIIAARFGMDLPFHAPGASELGILVAIVLAGLLTGLLPAWRAYSTSLGDGLQLRT